MDVCAASELLACPSGSGFPRPIDDHLAQIHAVGLELGLGLGVMDHDVVWRIPSGEDLSDSRAGSQPCSMFGLG